jgi:transcriptional regulator GlxA family with amidase domain
MSRPGRSETKAVRIAVFIFDGAEELDFVGPWEVLRAWAAMFPDDQVEVFTIAPTAEPVTCAQGLKVIADHALDAAPAFDVLVYPGGIGNRTFIGDETHRSWLQEGAARGALMTSVCTGSLVYADAGLLDGRAATTHWQWLQMLTALGKDVEPRETDRFVDTGDVITAAGVSAGIDMALHLVARLSSKERAREVRRMIQYDPAPPV